MIGLRGQWGKGGLTAFRELLHTTGSSVCWALPGMNEGTPSTSVWLARVGDALQDWTGTQTLPTAYVWWRTSLQREQRGPLGGCCVYPHPAPRSGALGHLLLLSSALPFSSRAFSSPHTQTNLNTICSRMVPRPFASWAVTQKCHLKQHF